MTTTRRFSALILSFTAGFGVPLVALATVPEASTDDAAVGYHTSSRVLAYHADAPEADMEALRVRLWALTENGGAPQCITDGVAAPCADVVALGAAD